MATTAEALSYLEYGWSVVPCHVPVTGGCSCGRDDCTWPGKHPRISWREYTSRRPTEKEVLHWFDDEFYESNLGVVTGQVSGVLVVDVDGGLERFKPLKLPKDTLVARSGGGGYHFYYECHRPVPSRIGAAPKIDIKADGGFIVLPPSVHNSGHPYRWIHGETPIPLDPTRLPTGGRTDGYGSSERDPRWFEELLDGVSEGGREVSTARLVGRYLALGLSEREIQLLLTAWNDLNAPPLPELELMGTIRRLVQRRRDINGIPLETTGDVIRWLLDGR